MILKVIEWLQKFKMSLFNRPLAHTNIHTDFQLYPLEQTVLIRMCSPIEFTI